MAVITGLYTYPPVYISSLRIPLPSAARCPLPAARCPPLPTARRISRYRRRTRGGRWGSARRTCVARERLRATCWHKTRAKTRLVVLHNPPFLPPSIFPSLPPSLPVPTAAHCPLPATRCSMLAASCPLPAARCTLPTTRCPLPTARCMLPAAHCPPLPATRCPLDWGSGQGCGWGCTNLAQEKALARKHTKTFYRRGGRKAIRVILPSTIETYVWSLWDVARLPKIIRSTWP